MANPPAANRMPVARSPRAIQPRACFRSGIPAAALVNASYVYDVETGLKLFGKTAFWVKAGDDYATFLRKGDAEEFASANSGALITFDEAIADFITEG